MALKFVSANYCKLKSRLLMPGASLKLASAKTRASYSGFYAPRRSAVGLQRDGEPTGLRTVVCVCVCSSDSQVDPGPYRE